MNLPQFNAFCNVWYSFPFRIVYNDSVNSRKNPLMFIVLIAIKHGLDGILNCTSNILAMRDVR